MCGLVGIYRFKSNDPVTTHEIEAMNAAQKHRGPDGEGAFNENALGLGHVRLSILDVSERANQPMHSTSDEAVIVYNGEVYNYIELRQALEAGKGSEFKTDSDTEVVLQHLLANGQDSQSIASALRDLNGMFALALWQPKENRLTIARDPVGIKPLYYVENEEGIYFASEIKALKAVLQQQWQVNTHLLDAYMSMGYVPGEESLVKGVKRLPAGQMLTIENGKLTQSCYWDFNFSRDESKTEQDWVQSLQQGFESSVERQLRSDVPLGVFLSGGVDSSAVVSTMSDLGVKDIKTFSVAWDYGKAYNETQYARQISEQYGTEHHEHFSKLRRAFGLHGKT
jgi:asparagine synthase (glutamine-hydrolysing)